MSASCQTLQRLLRPVLVIALLLHAAVVRAAADDDNITTKPDKLDVKLTASWYQSSDGNNANDVNLRGNCGDHRVWLGMYRDLASYQQVRAGYEFMQQVGPAQLVWSAQAASGGFLGGAINAQIGDPLYAIVGFGRTNLRNYYNLNFDPNDAITLGLGGHLNSTTEVSLYQIRDDRLPTRQRMTHLYLRQNLSDAYRYSVDASYKSGLNSDGNFVTGYGLTITVAFDPYFVRLARDPYANFGLAAQTRLSLGRNF